MLVNETRRGRQELQADRACQGVCDDQLSHADEDVGQNGAAQDLALVVEIPFDTSKRRGDKERTAGFSPEKRTDYLHALEAEIDASGDILSGRKIRSIEVHGSIGMVPTDEFGRYLGHFKRSHDVDPRGEYVIEMTPQTVGTPSLSSLNMGNFRCLRLDAYTLDKDAIAYLGTESVDGVALAMAYIENFRYQRVFLRCIYGVPGTNGKSVRKSLDSLTESHQIKEVTLFPYENTYEEGVSPEELLDQYQNAASILVARGFSQYAAGHFARKGGEDGSLLNRLAGMDVVGFGAGAWSRTDGFEYRNTPDIETYIAGSGDFERLVCFAREIREKDLLREKTLAALFRLGEVDVTSDSVQNDERLSRALEECEDIGLVEETEGIVRLSQLGSANFLMLKEIFKSI